MSVKIYPESKQISTRPAAKRVAPLCLTLLCRLVTPELVAYLTVVLTLSAQAQDGSANLPKWLSLSFEQQSRMQTLDGQFRAGLDGGDQAFEMRNTLAAEADLGEFSVQAEVADMRTWFHDEGTPLDSFTNNPMDILQANLSIPLSSLFSPEDRGFVKIGRFTMDLGSRRFIARNRYRNTINAFGGIHAFLQNGDSTFQIFYTQPTIRRVAGDWSENDPRLDRESSDKLMWGAFYETLLPSRQDYLETYVLGLDENRKQPANQRFDVIGVGARLYRNPAPAQWNYEVEAMTQFGDAPALDELSPPRDHRADYFHLALGYSFEAAWEPRLSFLYHFASGDKDPLDAESNSFDHYYGVPRPDFGPTGILRAFQRYNINSPGLMLNLQPASDVDAYIRLQNYSLAEAAQGWSTTRYRHPGNLDEDHAALQLETRMRWHLMDNKLTLDGGYTWLRAGSYMDLVGKGDSHYFYLQTIFRL
ncbi:MAG: alginate export family protein [Gammaproteobacteria bacterium]|nr:alginate export family protein [Gammaproteobacteria bacterium]